MASFRLYTPFVAFVLVLSVSVQGGAGEKGGGVPIGEGTVASIQYTLSDDKGSKIETSEGSDPIRYTHGKSNVVPGLKKALVGLHAGEERDIRVPPEEGFGKVDPNAFQEVPKDKVPAEALKVGVMLRAHSPEGVALPVRVSEVKDQTAVIDFNHPLAGKTLLFHVKV
ncbi:MAG: FKBP-type peptidyl-prolyl cis-trans isomerase, partial [Candidatus Binatia bacterium]